MSSSYLLNHFYPLISNDILITSQLAVQLAVVIVCMLALFLTNVVDATRRKKGKFKLIDQEPIQLMKCLLF